MVTALFITFVAWGALFLTLAGLEFWYPRNSSGSAMPVDGLLGIFLGVIGGLFLLAALLMKVL